MELNRRELLTDVFCRVLEDFGFMFSDPADPADLPTPSEGILLARMTFKGDASGEIVLGAPVAFCRDLAANVLGVDAEEADGRPAHDAVKELLNVTCGHVLTELAGPDAVFDLSVPLTSDLDQDDWSELAEAPDAAGFLIDEQPAILRLILDGEGTAGGQSE